MGAQNRRVIIVSDTLPIILVPKDEDIQSLRVSVSELSINKPRRRRRNGSIDLYCDSTIWQDSDHVLDSMEQFDLVDRHNHVAFWVSSNLPSGVEVIKIGKPVGVAPSEWEASPVLQSQAKRRYWDEARCIPVFLPAKVHKGHWEGYCRTSLWPLFHYVMWDGNIDASSQTKDWEDYVAANEAFCAAIMSIWKPNDVVWIMDYHLMLLPSLLRSRQDLMDIAMYMRSTFPSSELFRCLPRNINL